MRGGRAWLGPAGRTLPGPGSCKMTVRAHGVPSIQPGRGSRSPGGASRVLGKSHEGARTGAFKGAVDDILRSDGAGDLQRAVSDEDETRSAGHRGRLRPVALRATAEGPPETSGQRPSLEASAWAARGGAGAWKQNSRGAGALQAPMAGLRQQTGSAPKWRQTPPPERSTSRSQGNSKLSVRSELCAEITKARALGGSFLAFNEGVRGIPDCRGILGTVENSSHC